MIHYPYLNNKQFLQQIDLEPIKEHYLKLVVLDWDENDILEVQSQTNSGSVSINGDSSLRRTASISTVINLPDYDLSEISNIFSLNKKIRVEKGLKNNSESYSEYPILWFPQGTFIITGVSVQVQTNDSYQLNLSLQDKMCLLNGTVGGNIPAAAQLDIMDTVNANGEATTEKVRIKQIIYEVVNHFGGVPAGKIIISGVPNNILAPVVWQQDYPLILQKEEDEISIFWGNDEHSGWSTTLAFALDDTLTEEEIKENKLTHRAIAQRLAANLDAEIPTHWRLASSVAANANRQIYSKGEYIGYTWQPFVYSNKQGLSVSAGTTVTSILDTICNYINNMEYFFDVYGNFIFQEKKNNLNTTAATDIRRLISYGLQTKEPVLLQADNNIQYTFNDTQLITAMSRNPVVTNIKNDFVIWGKHSASGLPISYQVCIDNLPAVPDNIEYNNLFYYTAADGLRKANFTNYNVNYSNWLLVANPIEGEWYGVSLIEEIENKSREEIIAWKNQFTNYAKTPIQQTIFDIYCLADSTGTNWEETYNTMIQQLSNYESAYSWSAADKDYKQGGKLTSFNTNTLDKNNWQTYLYYRDLYNARQGRETSYYYARLVSEWPKVYDLEANTYKDSFLKQQINSDFYLEIVPADTKIGQQYSINNIGRRTVVVSNDKVNCLYEPDIPDNVFLGDNLYNTTTEQSINENNQALVLAEIKNQNSNYQIINVKNEWITTYTQPIGTLNSAYDAVRDLMYKYGTYNETIQLSTIPIYYMDVNQKVQLFSDRHNISGKYWIKNVSIPFDSNGIMNITVTELSNKF